MASSNGDRLGGRAAPEGTAAFAKAHPSADGFFRVHRNLTLSSLGLGSYLGDVGPEANRQYEEAAHVAMASGVNVLDTAINYRHQQSERDLGRAVRRWGRRSEIVVATKGGFLPFDAAASVSPQEYVRREFLASGLLRPDEVVGGVHSMAPAYLEDQLGRSLKNLGLDAVDIYFVHNPEAQLAAGVDRAEFEARLARAFEFLEVACDEGRIGVYGLATWDAFRVGPDHPNHIGLERVLELAQAARDNVGGGYHHFGAVELPVNIGMPEAAAEPTQTWQGEVVPALEAAREAGLLVLASATLLQTRLLGRLPPFVRQALQAETDVAAAIEFTRSCPGVTTALVGMGQPDHARANASLMLGKAPTTGVAGLVGGRA